MKSTSDEGVPADVDDDDIRGAELADKNDDGFPIGSSAAGDGGSMRAQAGVETER